MLRADVGEILGARRFQLAGGADLVGGVAGQHLVDRRRVIEQAERACSSWQRSIVTLSLTWASFGISSVNLQPGTLVSMALKTLLTLAGTLSLGSQRSRWLGPP